MFASIGVRGNWAVSGRAGNAIPGVEAGLYCECAGAPHLLSNSALFILFLCLKSSCKFAIVYLFVAILVTGSLTFCRYSRPWVMDVKVDCRSLEMFSGFEDGG